MLRLLAVVIALVFGFDALTNFEQPKEEAVVIETTDTRKSMAKPDKPTVSPEVQPAPNVEQASRVDQPSSNYVPQQQTTQVTPEVPSAPESVQQRLNRLALSVSSSLPFVAQNCSIPGYDPTQIRGCYTPGDSIIRITQYATMYDDAYVMCIMRHEARHVWQYTNGMMNIQDGVVINRDWLENDAAAASGCS
jgi:hypothetical protein